MWICIPSSPANPTKNRVVLHLSRHQFWCCDTQHLHNRHYVSVAKNELRITNSRCKTKKWCTCIDPLTFYILILLLPNLYLTSNWLVFWPPFSSYNTVVLSDQLYIFALHCYEILISYLTDFILTDWLTIWLIPSDKCNSITTKVTGLISSLHVQRHFIPRCAFSPTAAAPMLASWFYQSLPLFSFSFLHYHVGDDLPVAPLHGFVEDLVIALIAEVFNALSSV